MNSILELKYFEDETIDLAKIANLDSLEFINCDFVSCDIAKRSIRNTKFIECRFEKCNLANVAISGASFRDVTFKSCKILGVNWSSVNSSSELSFFDSLMDLCVFQGLDIRNMNVIDCSFKDGDFSQSNLAGAVFKNTNLNNTIFNGSDLSEADFREAYGYYIDPSFTKVKKAKFSMPEAMVLFKALEVEVS
jgi:fluoroquinolone resistance protein